ncbi:hypothetical protein [Streptomyces noursei]|uniref:hypothetical protein n=1 Tax=Streptomyces noursei TaxID=1971 RepID=UPI0005C8209B|nr:hypothetical protein [Streptomyces noursei]
MARRGVAMLALLFSGLLLLLTIGHHPPPWGEESETGVTWTTTQAPAPRYDEAEDDAGDQAQLSDAEAPVVLPDGDVGASPEVARVVGTAPHDGPCSAVGPVAQQYRAGRSSGAGRPPDPVTLQVIRC